MNDKFYKQFSKLRQKCSFSLFEFLKLYSCLRFTTSYFETSKKRNKIHAINFISDDKVVTRFDDDNDDDRIQ